MSYLIERIGFNPQKLPLEETLFHTANGYLGVRANFEEGQPEGTNSVRGTYINGFYETHPIEHPEKLFAFPTTGETVVNLPDVQTIRIRIDGEELSLNTLNNTDFHRFLDMRQGIAGRSFSWTNSNGKKLYFDARRLASFSRPELFAIELRIRALAALKIRIESLVQGDVCNYFDPGDPRVSNNAFKPLEIDDIAINGEHIRLEARTKASGLKLWMEINHHVQTEKERLTPIDYTRGATEASIIWETELKANETVLIEKFAVFGDSLRHPRGGQQLAEIAKNHFSLRFSDLKLEQERELLSFWDTANVKIEGDDHALSGLRFNLYHLYQSAGHDPNAHIAAKGLSGEGYEGHFFWDTEIYMFPFFLYTRPEAARDILRYRYTTLPQAREHAKELGHKKGAAFPWRTIAGRECSAFYPSGSAQYHINADIAWALWRYWEATEDMELMEKFGAELLFETARIWIEIGNYADGYFHIHNVTGPDEYTCLVNDNYYTNIMAQMNLRTAVSAYQLLSEKSPRRLREIITLIGLEANEISAWEKAAEFMTIPYDPARAMNPQDDSFFRKPKWDFNAVPTSCYPLLLHYHPMTLSRFQVCKQADTILAYILLKPDEKTETIKNSFSYYESITTHDSSLSYAAYAIISARLGDPEKAYNYFEKTVALDLDDSHHNTKDGIHAANMGGTWLATVWGFGGFYPTPNGPSFNPSLPACWKSLSYRIVFKGSIIHVQVKPTSISFVLESGLPCPIFIHDNKYLLKKELELPL